MDPTDLLKAVRESELPDEVKRELEDRLEAERNLPAIATQFIEPSVALQIQRAEGGEEVKSSLRMIATGFSFWEAAKLNGADPKEVWIQVERLGLIDFETPALLDRKARISTLADSRIEAHLLDPDAKTSLGELNFVSGTAADKILRAKPAPVEEENRFSEIVKLLQTEGGGKVSLEVTPAARTIDVTPVSASQNSVVDDETQA